MGPEHPKGPVGESRDVAELRPGGRTLTVVRAEAPARGKRTVVTEAKGSNEDLPVAAIIEAGKALGAVGGATRNAAAVLATLCRSNAEVAEVSALVGSEPALALRVLKVANSAFYGLSGMVGTVDRAIVVLGLNAVRGIAAAACLDRAIRRDRTPTVEPRQLLRHSVATAAAAQMLAGIHHPRLAPEAFIAGLLHDVGMLIADKIQARVPGATMNLHARIAAIVFAEWRLPANLIAAAEFHDQPSAAQGEQRALASLVHIADQLSRTGGMALDNDPSPDPQIVPAMKLLGLREQDVEEIAGKLPAQAEELHQALIG